MTKTDVLIFVEDPGAANYIAQLPGALAASGYQSRLVADGSAVDYLRQWNLSIEPIGQPVTAEQLLAQSEPTLLVVGTSENPQTLGLSLIEQAKLRQISTVGVVDALCNAHYRFRGESDVPLRYAPDWVLVPDPWTQSAFVDLGYPAEQIMICGHPHYDYVYETASRLAALDRQSFRQSVFPQAPSDRQVIILATELSESFEPELYLYSSDYSMAGRGSSPKRTDIVIEEFLEAIALIQPRPYLVLRLHPKNRVEEFTPYLNEFDQVSQGGSPLELIYAADLIVGLTSIVLLEARLMGKPALSILPRKQDKDTLLYLRLDVMPCVSTREELQTALQRFAVDPGSLLPQPADALQSDLFQAGSQQKLVNFIQHCLPQSVSPG